MGIPKEQIGTDSFFKHMEEMVEKTIEQLTREIDWSVVGYAMGKLGRDINIDQDMKRRAEDTSAKLRELLIKIVPDYDV